MMKMMKSECYKLFTKKAFYICAIILLVIIGADVWTTEAQFCMQYGFESFDLKQFGFTGWSAIIMKGMSTWILNMSSIFSSIFVCSEFSSGMIKNLSIRGKNKFVMYFSKLVTCLLVPVIYTILSVIVSYLIGAFLWSPGEWKPEYVDSILIPIGFFILVQLVFQSIFVMVGYVFESSGWTTGVNLGIATEILPGLLITGINFVLRDWFGLKEASAGKYWIGNIFEYKWPFDNEIMSVLPWLIVVYLVIPALIGSIIFSRREVK